MAPEGYTSIAGTMDHAELIRVALALEKDPVSYPPCGFAADVQAAGRSTLRSPSTGGGEPTPWEAVRAVATV